MNNDFKRASYLTTILLFIIGILALVAVSAAKFFEFDELVVTVSELVSLVAFFAMFISGIYSKSRYNHACVRFADYILSNRGKQADRLSLEAEHIREIQDIKASAAAEREKAVAAALEKGRAEGASAAAQAAQQIPPQAMPMSQQTPPQRIPMNQQMPPQRMPAAQRPPRQGVQRQMPLGEEVLYNEYGEPVMIRRKVRKTAANADGEMLYDGSGNPVIRRNQGLWEPLEQRHEIVVKVETSPGVTVATPEPERTADSSGGQQA